MDKSRAAVSLDDHLSAFAEAEVASGRYGSVTEVLQAGLRLLEDETAKLETLRAALIEGEESGVAEDFDFDDFLSGKRKAASAR